jgi:hypothetical protein
MAGRGFSVGKSLEVTPPIMPLGWGVEVGNIKIDITYVGYQDVN